MNQHIQWRYLLLIVLLLRTKWMRRFCLDVRIPKGEHYSLDSECQAGSH